MTSPTPALRRPALPPRPDMERIPRILLRAIVAMVLATLALTTYARVTGMEPAATPPDAAAGIRAERVVEIRALPDASATVWTAEGALVADLGPEQAGFIAGVHRALVRERMLAKVEGNPPVRLVLYGDGRLGLRDPETGWRVELISFGDTNRDAFLALLD